MEKEVIRISVRNLVEFILRSGDLDTRRGAFADREAMAKGSRIHRKIQKQMGAAYQAEVPLAYRTEFEEFSVLVEGRADGIIYGEDFVMVDEIKGVHRDLRFLEKPVEVHLAQAKCYAYFLGKEKDLLKIRVQMTYCHLDTEEIRRFEEEYTVEELEVWFRWLLDQYYQWALWQHQWKQTRNASMEGLEFPFPYREGQRDLVSGVYRTILRRKQLFIQAPTGVGKTMSTIFPAVRSMGEGLTEKIFYLTAKTITRTVAWEAFQILKRMKELGGVTAFHCENHDIVEYCRRTCVETGRTGPIYHAKSRPNLAESEAVARVLSLARLAGDAPVYIVHLSCKESLEAVRDARRKGQKNIFVETCPQYLLMDDSLYGLTGMEGAKYVCAPPLRKPEDSQCLWRALADGTIQTVSTDHCSFTTAQKALGKDDFTKIPGGMPGVETRGALLYTYGVDAGRITRERMCQLLSENPAKLYGMYPEKGVIAPGSDADIVVMRTGVEDTVTAADQVQNVDYAPFEGRKLTARIESVFLRGTQVVKDHQVVVEKAGRFVKRGKYAL